MTKHSRKRLFVLGIDGVPYSLVQGAFQAGRMPHLQRLAQHGSLVRMNSAIPVISSVAWAGFSTGVNPAKHGIFGFTDRDATLRYIVLTAANLKAKSLWAHLNENRKRVIAINVPGTYPPAPIHGILVGDFLSPSIEKATHPFSLVPLLKRLDYVIDAEPRLAYSDKNAFLAEITRALAARRELAFRFIEQEDWDFFMLHIMETDRMNHFFWGAKENREHLYHNEFWNLYSRVDDLIGRVIEELDEDTELMILSDHGFCGIHQEVDLNRYLTELGYLRFKEGAQALSDLDPSSVAYSLTPGRIYLNRKGRETNGNVDDRDAPRVLTELENALYELKDPESGKRVIQRVYAREEIYQGPLLAQAAELITHPTDGYDLKAGVMNDKLFSRTARSGMHTYEDALVYVRRHELKVDGESSIFDITPTIFDLMGLRTPVELEGQSLLAREEQHQR